MGLEIEGKFRVESHEPVRSRLRTLGAVRIGTVREVNHIFDDAGRALLGSGRGLRVRELTVLDGPSRPSTLTYKGPRTDATLKTREEIETPVGDARAARRILASLGFVEAVVFEKRRESWELAECRVELDELPHLGRYVEIEGPDESAVNRTQEMLGLAREAFVAETYVGMAAAYCRARGTGTVVLTFNGGSGL